MRKLCYSMDSKWNKVWRICLPGLLLVLCALGGPRCLTQCAYAKQVLPTSKRWAIVCSPDLQSTGLSDLLTAKLSTEHDFDLVERDLIAQVLDELEVVGFSGASERANRLKLGEALSANVLAILSKATAGPVTLKEKRYVSPDPNRVLKVPTNWGLWAHYGLIGWKEISGNSFRRFVLEDTDDYSK